MQESPSELFSLYRNLEERYYDLQRRYRKLEAEHEKALATIATRDCAKKESGA